MSELNRWGLGLMLWGGLLELTASKQAEAAWVFQIIACILFLTGFALLVHNQKES